MTDETRLWLRQFLYLGLLTALVHALQATTGILLWARVASPVMLAFGLDALVSGVREGVLARRIARYGTADVPEGTDRSLFSVVGGGYVLVSLVVLGVTLTGLWRGVRPAPTLLGVALAAISMLVIPIIGSYMKSLAMELRSPQLKQAAIFTFGNSYLSMVLLVSALVNAGMERWWGDPAGALIMVPFIAYKGIQLLLEHRVAEFTE